MFLFGNADLPEVQEEPEAIDIANHYQIIKRLGGSFTWESIDNMEFLTYQYIIMCMNYESRAEKLAQSQFATKEALDGN